jgi:hypothetical protein
MPEPSGQMAAQVPQAQSVAMLLPETAAAVVAAALLCCTARPKGLVLEL